MMWRSSMPDGLPVPRDRVGGAARRRAAFALVAVVAVASALPQGALAQAQQVPGDAAAGLELAGKLCSGCHLIDNRQRGPVMDGVPTFAEIARRLTPDEIQRGLLAPTHPVMPQPPLDARGRADVLAYIGTLTSN